MRRLHARGSASKGLVVDEAGAALGPKCILVRRTLSGFQCATPGEAAAVQNFVFGKTKPPDWLFEQCCRIAQALKDDQVALAQIYGVHSAPPDLDDDELAKLAKAAPFIKANFNPDEPRDSHGRWTGDSGETQVAADNQRENKMVRDIVVQSRLNKDQRQDLHREITGRGLSYHQILDIAKDMFGEE